MRDRMDFARPIQRAPLTLVVLLAGLVGTAGALWQREALLAERESLRASRAHLERSLRHVRIPAVATKDAASEIAALRTLGAALQRPWEGMLDALQAALAPDVRITRIQPGGEGLVWHISGEADGSEAFLTFVQRLRRDARWSTVTPVSEASLTAGPGVGKAMTFDVQVQWRATP